MEGFARHRVVEVHRDGVFFHRCNLSLYYLALLVQHRDGASYYEEVATHFAVNGKRTDRASMKFGVNKPSMIIWIRKSSMKT